MNFYKHHLGDYAIATAHLSWDEDMAYSRLLRVYYQTEKPIPADHTQAYRIARASSAAQRKAVDVVLAEFFTLESDGYHQKRCDIEIEQATAKANKNREVGNLGGRPKKTMMVSENNHDGSEMEPCHNPSQTPDSRLKTKPTEAIASDGKPSKLTSDEIIFGYGVPLLTNAGTTEKQARSFLGGLRKAHGDAVLIDRLRDCMRAKPLQPLEWLAAALPPLGKNVGKQAQLESRNAAVVADWQPLELREEAA